MEGQIKCFPEKVKLKEFIITKPLLCEMLRDLSKKKMIKNMNSKMTRNNYQQPNLKNKNKLSKQLEQELETTWRVISKEEDGREWRMGENEGIRSINSM